MKEIKTALPGATAGEVLTGIELLVCHRQELNPLLVPVQHDGRLVDRPLEASGRRGVAGGRAGGSLRFSAASLLCNAAMLWLLW